MTQLSRAAYWGVTSYTSGALGAAGAGAVTGLQTTGYNMSGFEGFVFIATAISGGTSAANNWGMSVSQATSASATGTTITGATGLYTVTSSSGTIFAAVVDVWRFRRATGEFLSGIISSVSSCAIISPLVTLRYGAHSMSNTTTLGAVLGTVPNSSAGSTDFNDVNNGVIIVAAT